MLTLPVLYWKIITQNQHRVSFKIVSLPLVFITASRETPLSLVTDSLVLSWSF